MKIKILIPLFILFFSACSLISTNIATIEENPSDYDGKEVTISGTVKESVNLFVIKYYTVNDGTGTIHVKTKDSVPSKGEKVRVKGTVNQVLKLGQGQFMGIVETERN